MKPEAVYRMWLCGQREFIENGKLHVINGVYYETQGNRRYRMLEVLCEGLRISYALDSLCLH